MIDRNKTAHDLAKAALFYAQLFSAVRLNGSKCCSIWTPEGAFSRHDKYIYNQRYGGVLWVRAQSRARSS